MNGGLSHGSADSELPEETGLTFIEANYCEGMLATVSKQALEYAQWLSNYAKTQGWKDWQLLGVADRNLVSKLERQLEAKDVALRNARRLLDMNLK